VERRPSQDLLLQQKSGGGKAKKKREVGERRARAKKTERKARME
jgi:hypothetical protein